MRNIPLTCLYCILSRERESERAGGRVVVIIYIYDELFSWHYTLFLCLVNLSMMAVGMPRLHTEDVAGRNASRKREREEWKNKNCPSAQNPSSDECQNFFPFAFVPTSMCIESTTDSWTLINPIRRLCIRMIQQRVFHSSGSRHLLSLSLPLLRWNKQNNYIYLQ